MSATGAVDEATALLTAIGYRPDSRLADAAARLARAPVIVADLREYVALGQPPADYDRRTPTCLFRPLPLALCVAVLLREAGLTASGAFLLAALLSHDPARGEALIASMVDDGVWHTAADGTRSLRYPTLLPPLSHCQHCGRPQFHVATPCGRCTDAVSAAELPPERQAIAELLAWLDSLPEAGAVEASAPQARSCPACGAGNTLHARFCLGCGHSLSESTACATCGRALNPMAHYCGGCGAKTDGIHNERPSPKTP